MHTRFFVCCTGLMMVLNKVTGVGTAITHDFAIDELRRHIKDLTLKERRITPRAQPSAENIPAVPRHGLHP